MKEATVDFIEDVKAMSDDEFMEKYEKLVHHFVWKKYGKRLDSIENDTNLAPEDLTQIGMIGLIKARKAFDHTLGYKFSTYVMYKIHGEIGRAIRECSKVKAIRSIYELKGKILMHGLHEKSPEDIGAELDASIENVEVALQHQPGTLSLNKVIYESHGDQDITLEGTLVDKYTERMEEEIENKMVLDSFVNTLEHKEFFVWDMHSENMIQQSIADRVGVCQVQVGRILKRINRKAADFGRRQGLSG